MIFIRHGKDDVKNEYTYDPPLLDKGIKESENLGLKLIKKYGIPNKIYCSPMLRGRQTLKSMIKTIPKNQLPEIYMAPALSRYFFTGQQDESNINPNSTHHIIPIHEDMDKFNQRVDEFYKNIIRENKKNGIICWYITHTMVLKRISKKRKLTIPKYIPYNYVMVIRN